MITRITLLLEVSPELSRAQRKALRAEAVDVLNERLDFSVIDSPRIAYFINSADDV